MQELAENLIDALGTDGFYEFVSLAVRDLSDADFVVTFEYPPHSPPLALFNHPANPGLQQGIKNFAASTYIINPFYTAFRNDIATGLYFMRDLVSDDWTFHSIDGEVSADADAIEEIGYRTHGWPANMQELIAAIRVSPDTVVDITVSRATADGGFGTIDLSALRKAFPVLAAAITKHWSLTQEQRKTSNEAVDPQQHFNTFGSNLLSERERSVIRLILLGHSSEAISLTLGIALPTVKSHRRNAYRKLEISTQAELLNTFLAHLGQQTAHPSG